MQNCLNYEVSFRNAIYYICSNVVTKEKFKVKCSYSTTTVEMCLLTYYWNGYSIVFVGVTVVVFYLNSEIIRPCITLLKGINLQRTVLLSNISQQLCPILIVLQHLRLLWMEDESVLIRHPKTCEFSGRSAWIWVVKWAGDDHTWAQETFNWGWYLCSPRWGFGLHRCRKRDEMKHKCLDRYRERVLFV